jgi:hypothetical protein
LTLSTTVKGYTLRARVHLDMIEYFTGDNGVAVCSLGTERFTGSPAQERSGCDHIWRTRGDFALTATTTVIVDWSGAGRSGSFKVQVSRSGTVHVGEIQVLIVR